MEQLLKSAARAGTKGSERGATSVETAVALTLFLGLIVFIIDVGLVMRKRLMVLHAHQAILHNIAVGASIQSAKEREFGRFGITDGTASMAAIVKNAAGRSIKGASVRVTASVPCISCGLISVASTTFDYDQTLFCPLEEQ